MKYQVFSENEWVYPDSEITKANKAELFSARNADVCFQILTDLKLCGGERISFEFNCEGCDAIVYQLLSARVFENSHVRSHTTMDYESVKHFVTRQAPFEVYEVTKPLDDGETVAERAAFYVRINVAENAPVGTQDTVLTIDVDDKSCEIPVSIKIYSAKVPSLDKAEFHMVNWLYYTRIAENHKAEIGSEKYMQALDGYLENQIDMRNDYLMIPAGTPIKDENGKVVDFDFTNVEKVGNRALKWGFKYIMGGFVAHWAKWDEPPIYLIWDKDTEVTTIEAYRQLKIYFKRALECIEKNGWQNNYMQCLVDEPQFQSSPAYRALSAICRKCMPGVIINDPVESTELAGAVDVWVVKQAIYEKYLEDFQTLQAAGEKMWIYTCGFPAGKTMNRIADLPLNASRLPMWMCYKYNAPGFLHWGYHVHNPEGRFDINKHYPKNSHPAGNSFVVYLTEGKPWYSVRGHLQRTGAHDYELLNILGKTDKSRALAIIDKVCRTFDDYEFSAEALDSARRELLEAIG